MRFERSICLCAVLFLMLSGCASKPQTQRALQGAGRAHQNQQRLIPSISRRALSSKLAEPCPGVSDAPIAASSAYKSSWTALDILQQRLRERLSEGDYSHILVAIMGWNTTQIEAVRNFNAIAKNIRAAADDDFNPLFIGVTWPSQWQNEWLAPLYKLASFPNKAQDADELGLMWLGVLLNDTLPAIDPQTPIVVIGHSFGARAATTAACAGPVIHRPGSPIAKKQLDQLTLIGLQGAFRINRLFGQFSDRKIGFQDQCRSVGHIYLTSSLADTANDTAFWGDYAGDEASYTKFCGEESRLVNCEKADQSGHRTQQRDVGSNITYIDADDLIYLNSYLSGGGAHSDIYRKEHGLLMYDLISRSKAISSASDR